MKNQVLSFLIKIMPKGFLAQFRHSDWAKPIRRLVNRNTDNRLRILDIDIHYNVHGIPVDFRFSANPKPALKAAKNGLENKIIHRVYEYAKSVPQGHIVDVGTNFGFLSTVWSKTLPQLKVVGFEADPSVHAIFKKNVEFNQLSNYQLHNKAISSVPGTLQFKTAIHVENMVYDENHAVEATTLDAEFKQRTIPVIAIKIDTDGHDFDCVKGAKKLIAEDHPMVVIELNKDLAIPAFFFDMGYELYDMNLTRITSLNQIDINLPKFENLFCFHPDRPEYKQFKQEHNL
ncbi:MAG: FkbM family methyltransferase [Chitinophagaceae bacterium]|nr:FkbM family methyltransferase [Chitinophagaceae bacterium]